MTLQQAEIEQLITQLKPHLTLWLAERAPEKATNLYEMELRERMVRVEEELKHQRELMKQGFELMEKRFEQVDKRFEQVERRLDQFDKRFELWEKKFDSMSTRLDRFMIWSFGITFTATGLVIAAMRFWH